MKKLLRDASRASQNHSVASNKNASPLTIFPAPAGAAISSWYRVAVNDQAVPVYDARVDEPHNCAFASFDFIGKVRVTITAPKAFKRAVVRPLSAGVKAIVKGKSINFTLDRPRKLCVELDGNLTRPLLIFANTVEADAPTADTPTLRYFGPGIHTPGEIKLASDQSVYIAGGAVVKGYFTAEHANNIRIFGRGVMDAHENSTSMIRFVHCTNVQVEGITIADQPKSNWTTVFVACDDVVVRDIKIIAGDNVSNDGIDIVSCQRFLVDDCFVKCFDDCIVVKAVKTDRRNISDIEIRNCLLWNIQAYSVQIGAELDCERVENIYVHDCDCIHCQQVETNTADRYLYYCAVLGILNGDDSVVSNVRFENIRVEDATSKLISIKIMKTEWNHSAGFGEISDISFKNISVLDGQFVPSEILTHGFGLGFAPSESAPKSIPKNITVENLTILGQSIANAQQGGFIVNPYCEGLKFVVKPLKRKR